MLKWLGLAGITVLFAAVVFVTRYDKLHNTSSEGYEAQCIQPNDPSATAPSLVCTIEHSQKAQHGKYEPVWWHVFFAWPEGITAWLLMLTLGAIAWQAWETRKTADASQEAATAALRQIEISRQRERPRLRLELEPVSLDFTENPDVVVIKGKIRNYGGSIAFIVINTCACWIGEADSGTHPSYDMNLPEAILPVSACDPAICLFDEARVVDSVMWDKDDPRIKAVRSGAKSIYVGGIVVYTNIFEETWIFGFKRKYTVQHYGVIAQGDWRHEPEGNYERQESPKPN